MNRPSKNCEVCNKMTDCLFMDIKAYVCWDCKKDLVVKQSKYLKVKKVKSYIIKKNAKNN